MRHLKPREIQGCQLALDASIATSLYDATSGGSLVAADGAVARWEDQSGNARHATQTTSANRPLRKVAIQGGSDGLRFDGSNDKMIHGASSGSQPNTLFVACKWLNTGQTAYRGLLVYGNGATDAAGAMLLIRTSTNFVGAYQFTPGGDSNSTYTASTSPIVITQTETTAPQTDWTVNANSAGSQAKATGAQGTTHICGDTAQETNADVYAAGIWNLALSTSVQNRLQGATMRKWRING